MLNVCYLCGAVVVAVAKDGVVADHYGRLQWLCSNCIKCLKEEVAIRCCCGNVWGHIKRIASLMYLSEANGFDCVGAALRGESIVINIFGCENCVGNIVWQLWRPVRVNEFGWYVAVHYRF